MVFSILKRFDKGTLKLFLPNGEELIFGGGKGLQVDLKIHNNSFFKKVVSYGDIGFGESYCDGDWSTSNLTNLFKWVIQNIENSGLLSGSKAKAFGLNFFETFNKIKHFFNRNSKKGSKSNIAYHYDLSNSFYQIMLDETMSYSSGIFENKDSTLMQAQELKLEKICKDLDLRPDDHVLEIGCGWGSFAIYAVKNYNCRVTGVTISKEQYKFALEKISKLGLEDKITILLQDYREITDRFDKIVSIEMIEAVGHTYLPMYFEKIDTLLKQDGVAVIQAITSPDSRYDSFRKGVDFIQKHIFPGTLLPSIRAMTNACNNTSLHIYNLRDIGLHYAKTLRIWDEKIKENLDEIRGFGMDDVFFRKWEYYLCYCEAAFAERNISDIQLTLIKANNTNYKMI